MSRPRNPRYFPRMKVRGARRRRVAGFQRMTGALDTYSLTAWQTGVKLSSLARAMELAR